MGVRVFALLVLAGLFTAGVVLLQVGAPRSDESAMTVPPVDDGGAATAEDAGSTVDVVVSAEGNALRTLASSSVVSNDENAPVTAAGNTTLTPQGEADALPPLFDQPPFCRYPPGVDFVAGYAYWDSLSDAQRSRCIAHGVLQAATGKGLKFSELPPEHRMLFEERDPAWARDTENALVNLIARLEGVTLSSLKTECKSTICTADVVIERFTSSQMQAIPILHPQIERLAKENGLSGELNVGAPREGNWWFQAVFTRVDGPVAASKSN